MTGEDLRALAWLEARTAVPGSDERRTALRLCALLSRRSPDRLRERLTWSPVYAHTGAPLLRLLDRLEAVDTLAEPFATEGTAT